MQACVAALKNKCLQQVYVRELFSVLVDPFPLAKRIRNDR